MKLAEYRTGTRARIAHTGRAGRSTQIAYTGNGQPLVDKNGGTNGHTKFTRKAREIIVSREKEFGGTERSIRHALQVAIEIAGVVDEHEALEALKNTNSLRGLRQRYRYWNRKKRDVELRGSSASFQHSRRELAEERPSEAMYRIFVDRKVIPILTAIIAELPQYTEDRRYDVRGLLVAALHTHKNDEQKQKVVIEAAVYSWGINDLIIRLNKLLRSEDVDIDFSKLIRKKKDVALKKGASFDHDEMEFLMKLLGLQQEKVKAEIDEGDRSTHRRISDRLDKLISIAPDRRRARIYADLLRDRFGIRGLPMRIEEMAISYGTTVQEMARKTEEALIALGDLLVHSMEYDDDAKIPRIKTCNMERVNEIIRRFAQDPA